jgi:type I restriction enzyme S subunit|tara:strand:+ start:594 stop:1793 length:1200 start_codon:yes stop_codon:yes gene_type:complete
MKKGWENKQLIQLCHEITDGTHSSPKSSPRYNYPYITVKDIKEDIIDFDNCKFISADDFFRLKKNGCMPNNGDVLFSKDGTVGKVSIVDYDKEFIVLSSLAIIRPNRNLINPYYLKYVFKSPLFLKNAVDKKTGVAIKRIILKNLKQIDVQYPISIPEQKRIVTKLDKCFEAIDKARANVERNLQNAKDLFQSQLNQIFSQKDEGWVEKKLKEIGDTQTGSTPSTKNKDNYGNHIPFVKPAHFNENGSINAGNSMLSEKGLKSARFFEKYSTLMVCIGATIGKTGFTEIPVTSNQQINALTPKGIYEPKYFYYALLTESFFSKVIHASSQLTLPIINKSKWENLTVPIPSNKHDQTSIVTQLDQLKAQTQSLQSNYQQELDALDELKKSILEKAFNGEL